MNQNDINKFCDHLYSRLPKYYKYVDFKENNEILKRYLASMDASFTDNNNKIMGLVDLSQISKCPEEYLSVIGHSFGADWIDTISVDYQRKVLSALVEMYKYKGTYTPVEHLSREISGFEVEVLDDYIPPEYAQEGDAKKRKFTIKLLAPDDNRLPQEGQDTIETVISHFVPIHSRFVLLIVYFFNEEFVSNFTESDEKTTIKQINYTEEQAMSIIEEFYTNVTMTPIAEETSLNLNPFPDCSSIRDSKLITRDGELILSPYENCDKIIIRKGSNKPITVYI